MNAKEAKEELAKIIDRAVPKYAQNAPTQRKQSRTTVDLNDVQWTNFTAFEATEELARIMASQPTSTAEILHDENTHVVIGAFHFATAEAAEVLYDALQQWTSSGKVTNNGRSEEVTR